MAPEISTPRPYDEARLARASKLVQASYAALNLALLTHYALSRDLYHTGLALGTLALFPVMHVFYRLTRLKRVHQMDIFIYIFTLIAYTGGELLGGYAQLKSLTNLRFANESARPLVFAPPTPYGGAVFRPCGLRFAPCPRGSSRFAASDARKLACGTPCFIGLTTACFRHWRRPSCAPAVHAAGDD